MSFKEFKPKFTSGEWKSNPLTDPTNPRYYCIYTKDGDESTINHIAIVDSQNLINKGEVHYNKQLIENSPDMYKLLHLMSNDSDVTDFYKTIINELIDKIDKSK